MQADHVSSGITRSHIQGKRFQLPRSMSLHRTERMHEACGVFGIYRRGGDGVVAECYHALYALQHRGQEGCGIAVNNDGIISYHRDLGLVSDVFTQERLAKLPEGQIAIAHCKYGTDQLKRRSNVQPLIVNHLKGSMGICHNGSLVNARPLRRSLEEGGAIFHSTTDTEVIAYTITQQRLKSASIEEAVRNAMHIIRGAYSLVIMSATKLIAVRDPNGFRPLCMGKIGEDVVFASESCALEAIGATFERDLQPGEVVVVNQDGVRTYPWQEKVPSSLCVFEYVYFARPDSVVDGVSVHEARLRAGAFLAKDHPVEADVVIGVPDSGIDAAVGYARESGIPYGIGFIKNKYIGRTFIVPGQKQREGAVRIKLNVVSATVRGKRVVLVDDSIVRGTTSARIVRLLRDAGATEIHIRLTSPPFKHPCFFGTDIDSRDVLIAHNHSPAEIGRIIGVDSIGFLELHRCDDMASESTLHFCKGCFTGVYPMDVPDTPKHILPHERKLSQRPAEG